MMKKQLITMMKNIINHIKVNLLGIKPVFKIKIVKSLFLGDYFITFSGNNGWTWETITRATVDYGSTPLRKIIVTEYYPKNRVVEIANMFNTYKICRKHNDDVVKSVKVFNSFNKKTYDERELEIRESIKNFNKKK